ncbi:SNAP-25 homologue, t-SNARE component Sec9 [Schizosaccharomyces pombe]|uniref:Protein transport protein sec9 n=1 Tax=Schizosaccharomyces pombe (strain 972 / ATCC 24843) TaxID=284812 RepID=SEC9_SCHPO|nr:protein transport protein [Schizosaccharomyces pombe]O74786.1 RecName: Full=Protein transport protein sec9 [Schizosaccharomyces pombe 972h-]CAA21094.1 SNAP-25 homologue, t-SNARE component Sec9 [Schizosaccharomyces pombe]|eukprot:NP_596643.1 protein transport protein [Schizosaccharomyces pombe]
MKKLFKKKKGVSPHMYMLPEESNSNTATNAPSYSVGGTTANSYSSNSYNDNNNSNSTYGSSNNYGNYGSSNNYGSYGASNTYGSNGSSNNYGNYGATNSNGDAGYSITPIRNDPYARKDMPPMKSSAAVTERPSMHRSAPSQDTLDLKKQELFAGARIQNDDESTTDTIPHNDDGTEGDEYGEGYRDGYEEDQEVEAIKQKIQFVKQDSLSSTRNALLMAGNAEQMGLATLANLGEQTEKIATAEKELDISKIHAKRAEEQARELKTLNRSMFAIHVPKPWGKAKRVAAEEARLAAKRDAERQDEMLNRQFAYRSQKRIDQAMKDNMKSNKKKGDSKGVSILERSHYQFEPDAEDDAMEKEIDGNLDQIGALATRLKGLAYATGQEIDSQNARLGSIHDKSDRLDTDVYLNVERLRHIH